MSFQDLEGSSEPSSGHGQAKTESRSVAAGIFQINTAVAGFHRLVDAIGTLKDSPELRQKLHSTRQRIGQLVKETSAKLKAREGDLCEADPRKRTEESKLARDFQAVLLDFQKAQKLAAEREMTCSSLPSSSSLHTRFGSSGIDEHVTPDTDRESLQLLWEQNRQEILLFENEVAFNEAMIEEREQGISDVQGQIGEVAEIYKDLAVLVHDQHVIIDDIGTHIEVGSSATAQAGAQLTKASKSIKSRSSWCLWMLIILVVVVGIIFLILII